MLCRSKLVQVKMRGGRQEIRLSPRWQLGSAGGGSHKLLLGTSEPALWATVWPSKLSTFRATPDYYFSAVGARKFCRLFLRRNSSVARCTRRHNCSHSLAHSDTSRKTRYGITLLYVLSFNAFLRLY